MFTLLKNYIAKTISVTDTELELVAQYFEEKTLRKKAFLLQDHKVCNFIAFIATGAVRHFHVKDGMEKTCDISFENSWVTDFQSFTTAKVGLMNLQVLEDTTLLLIEKTNLLALYKKCSKYETFGRLMAEQVAQRATEIAMSLSADKPEERFIHLINTHPFVFQRVPQKYIANFLGISPESLSRLRKRIYNKQKS